MSYIYKNITFLQFLITKDKYCTCQRKGSADFLFSEDNLSFLLPFEYSQCCITRRMKCSSHICYSSYLQRWIKRKQSDLHGHAQENRNNAFVFAKESRKVEVGFL